VKAGAIQTPSRTSWKPAQPHLRPRNHNNNTAKHDRNRERNRLPLTLILMIWSASLSASIIHCAMLPTCNGSFQNNHIEIITKILCFLVSLKQCIIFYLSKPMPTVMMEHTLPQKRVLFCSGSNVWLSYKSEITPQLLGQGYLANCRHKTLPLDVCFKVF